MRRHEREVLVGGEHHQAVADAQLSEQHLDRPDLDSISAAGTSYLGRPDMVGSVGDEQRERSEAIDDIVAGLGPSESLEELL